MDDRDRASNGVFNQMGEGSDLPVRTFTWGFLSNAELNSQQADMGREDSAGLWVFP